MRELRFICFTIVVLTLTGIFISCTTPKPPVRRPPFTNAIDLAVVTPSLAVARSAIVPRPKPKPTPVGWDAVSGAERYVLYFSRGNEVWYKTLDVGTNTTVNLIDILPPLAIRVTASNAAMESLPSIEIYIGVRPNGWPMAGQFVIIADLNSVYRLSNSPLTRTNWTLWTTISNRQGLVTLPLPNQSSLLKWTAER